MFIEQAYKGDNAVWKVLLTTLITTGIMIMGLIQFLFFDIDVKAQMDQMYALFDNKNFWLAVNLLPFAFLLILLFVMVYVLHKRNIMSLTTTRKKVDWSRIGFSILLVVILNVITIGMTLYFSPDDLVLQFDPLQWGILLVISLLLFPFQIGFEEWIFRGYLMQQIGVAVKNRWMPLLLTSIFFGIAHGANPEVAEMGYITMVFYIGTGLLLGIMTLMDDGLELALGFHFANNFLISILLTADHSALQTNAIFKSVAPAAAGFEIVMPVLIFYPIVLLIMAKKYGWSNWKEKLTGKVVKPAPVVEEQAVA